MIMAKARLIGEANGRVRVGLSLPTGFDPEEVIRESVLGNGTVSPDEIRVEPRAGRYYDVFREFEVYFSNESLAAGNEERKTLKITGKLRRGLPFTASVPIPARSPKNPTDH
jgi:hypothetical protein